MLRRASSEAGLLCWGTPSSFGWSWQRGERQGFLIVITISSSSLLPPGFDGLESHYTCNINRLTNAFLLFQIRTLVSFRWFYFLIFGEGGISGPLLPITILVMIMYPLSARIFQFLFQLFSRHDLFRYERCASITILLPTYLLNGSTRSLFTDIFFFDRDSYIYSPPTSALC